MLLTNFFFEDINKFFIFYEFIMHSIAGLSFMFIFIQHIGNLLICLIRTLMINSLLKERKFKVNYVDNDYIRLYKNRSSNTVFQIIIDILH